MTAIGNHNLILGGLDPERVPVLPPGAAYLLKALNDDNVGYAELAAIVERFPSIAGRLVALANSAWSAPVSEITSLKMACARLGVNVVRSVSIALAIASPFDASRCPAFEGQRFWCTALLNADAASWLAPLARAPGPVEPQTARTGGLLHNLGLLWLADQLPDSTNEALSAAVHDPELSVRRALNEICGIDYRQAGHSLGKAWALPPVLVAAMGPCDGTKPQDVDAEWSVARTVCSAAMLVSALYAETPNPPEDPGIEQLGITPEGRAAVFARLSDRFDDTRELAKTLFTGGGG